MDSLWPSVRRVDSVNKEVSLWPYTRTIRKLTIDVKIVESQIEKMQKEISFLEQQFDSKKMCESKKRCRTEMKVDEKSSKKLAMIKTQKKSFFEFDSEKIFSSSVLLTPSPERDESDLDTTTFWSTMRSFESSESNSPTGMEQNVSLPGLNDLFHECNAIEINALEISKEMQNTEESVEQTNEESAMEKELEVIEPNVPFINLDNYNESLCINPNVIIKTEPKQLELEENENEEPTNDSSFQTTISSESHRTSSPLMLSIDGNIELEPLRPLEKTSKQIKFNLTNSKVVEPRIQSPKTPDISSDEKEEQTKLKMPSEWKTPLITFKVKKSMKNVTFHEQPICRKGWEQTGMCSIM